MKHPPRPPASCLPKKAVKQLIFEDKSLYNYNYKCGYKYKCKSMQSSKKAIETFTVDLKAKEIGRTVAINSSHFPAKFLSRPTLKGYLKFGQSSCCFKWLIFDTKVNLFGIVLSRQLSFCEQKTLSKTVLNPFRLIINKFKLF